MITVASGQYAVVWRQTTPLGWPITGAVSGAEIPKDALWRGVHCILIFWLPAIVIVLWIGKKNGVMKMKVVVSWIGWKTFLQTYATVQYTRSATWEALSLLMYVYHALENHAWQNRQIYQLIQKCGIYSHPFSRYWIIIYYSGMQIEQVHCCQINPPAVCCSRVI